MNRLGYVGVVAVLFGFAVLVEHGLARVVTVGGTVLTLVGVLAAVQGLRYGWARRHVAIEAVDPGDPEVRYRVPTPGDDIDLDLLGTRVARRPVRQRPSVDNRLGTAAIEALVAHRGVDHSTATETLTTGSWTDDPVAATFFQPGVGPPAHAYVRAMLARESVRTYTIRRTIAAIAAIQEVDA